MKRTDLADLSAFATVAAERSFTRAAARLGVSQSALSHAMRGLVPDVPGYYLYYPSRRNQPAALIETFRIQG